MRLITNSDYSLEEIERNVEGVDPARVAVVHHGIPDRFGEPDGTPRERVALTVGAVYSVNLARKGHRPFVEAARELPDVEFVLAGEWWDETGERLAAEAAPNVRVTGRLSDEDLDALFTSAAVYVQASLHEGFGLLLAEAMLAGAVPVVTPASALPEVVCETGVTIAEPTPAAVAAGVRQALSWDPMQASPRASASAPTSRTRSGATACSARSTERSRASARSTRSLSKSAASVRLRGEALKARDRRTPMSQSQTLHCKRPPRRPATSSHCSRGWAPTP